MSLQILFVYVDIIAFASRHSVLPLNKNYYWLHSFWMVVLENIDFVWLSSIMQPEAVLYNRFLKLYNVVDWLST